MFAALSLQDCPHIARGVFPQELRRAAVEEPDERHQWSEGRDPEEPLEDRLPSHVVERAYAVDGDDDGVWVEARHGTQQVPQRIGPCPG